MTLRNQARPNQERQTLLKIYRGEAKASQLNLRHLKLLSKLGLIGSDELGWYVTVEGRKLLGVDEFAK